jgi:DNA primase
VAGRVPEYVIQQILGSVDFVRLASRFCDLKKKGRTFWALCPFHKEKTPSFSLDPENGLYYCFGCKEGGNAFTLLQKLEGLSFGEALRALAAEAGVDLSQYEAEAGPGADEMERMRRLNELATAFYERCLQKARGSETARDYLAGRSISPDSIEKWRIGYAPDGWEHFLKCARGRAYEPEIVEKVGLALPRQNTPGHYDRFRNRLMFPIGDSVGRTIGFGARALSPDDEPKYLNTPETPLFDKGSSFFGLGEAREAIRSSGRAVILEGYTDVIMAHQHGVCETVAVLGTALTEHHARRLARLARRVVLVFDADEAGQNSAARSIEVLLNEDLEIRVARLPAGQDPCEYIVAEGGEEFGHRLDESQEFWEFRLARARSRFGDDSIESRSAALRDVLEMVLAVRDPARRGMIVQWVAHELGVRERDAWAYVERSARRTSGRRPETAAGARNARRSGLKADDVIPGELLGLILAHPDLAPRAAEGLDLEQLKDCPAKELLAEAISRGSSGSKFDTKAFLASLDDAPRAAAASRALGEETVREERITQATPAERLEGYLEYLSRVRAGGTAPLPRTDEELRAYVERLKDKDRSSARVE